MAALYNNLLPEDKDNLRSGIYLEGRGADLICLTLYCYLVDTVFMNTYFFPSIN